MASGGTTKVPPIFKEDEMDYETWKKDVNLWTSFTELVETKHAIAVHLSLSGRARKASSELSVDDLKANDGMKKLIEKLDRVFLQDENWKCFHTYLAFENYRRPEKCNIDSYLSEFDLRHYKLKECKVNLPDAVVACRLLKSCGLSDMHFQLALSTTSTMTFEEMRKTLKKLFAENGHLLTGEYDASREDVKVDPVFNKEAFYSTSRGRSVSNRRKDTSKRANPLNADGTVSVCAICSSKMHWAKSCPHAYERQSPVYYGNEQYDEPEEEVHVSLFTGDEENNSKMKTLLGETIGSVILDSGCSKTVCGEEWYRCYEETLTDDEKKKIKSEPSKSVYRFGDGKRMKSNRCVVIPCVLADKTITIKTDIVDCCIPLLLSRSSMKTAGMIIDLKSDTVMVFGKTVKLGTTSMGHITLPIIHPPTVRRIECTLLCNTDGVNKKSLALKLHKQFAHPSADRLRGLLKNAGKDDPDLLRAIDLVTENCETCVRYKRPRPRPVVAMPMAKNFNETVAMDLKIWNNGIYFLVIVDHATRFCSAVVINSKKPCTIIEALFQHWITIFGAPRQFLSDNGGEFNNDEMRTLADSFGIKLVCTAAESPWSNSICERLNCVLGISVTKIRDDAKCSLKIALSWAVSARNALQNCHGYSPNQLVFGYNPALPNVYHSELPVLEKRTTSQMVADNLNAMHAARVDFMKNESNERLRRALLHQVRTSDVDDLVNGDNVFYKRRDSDQWHGPGIVIGMDGKQVLVRHGGTYVRVHTCRLQHAVPSVNKNLPADLRPITDKSTTNLQSTSADHNDESSDESENEAAVAPHQQQEPSFVTPTRKDTTKPKIGQKIECWLKNDGEKFDAKVISRAGKAGGIHGNCYNIQRNSGEVEWIDLARQVEKWRPLPEDNVVETDDQVPPSDIFMASYETPLNEAKLAELENWKDNNVFEEVSDQGQNAVSVRWVVTEKTKNGVPYTKARLVARGFEENLHDHRTDSPTCAKDSLRVALTLIAAHGWNCNSIDIKAAFLQGESIDRDIYLKPPKEFDNGSLWKLKKTVYGLCDAARSWYFRVKDVLLKIGMKMCSLDQALFFLFSNGVLSGIICIHVDDFCWAGTDYFKSSVVELLKKCFLIGDTNCGSFKYLGVHLSTDDDGCIGVDQSDYIRLLEEINLDGKHRQRADELTDAEKNDYRALVGQLNWVATQTRPDASFDVCELSSVFDKARVDDLMRANKVVKKIKSRTLTMKYPKLDDREQFTIECYSDASYGNLEGGGSQGGYFIFIVDSDGRRCPVSWQSRRVRRVVKSTLAAETLALLEAAEAGVFIATLLAEALSRPVADFLVNCLVDNRSLVDALYSTKAVDDKHLRINMAVLRDMLSRKDIHSVKWVRSAQQLANVLTKRGVCPAPLLSAISDCPTN